MKRRNALTIVLLLACYSSTSSPIDVLLNSLLEPNKIEITVNRQGCCSHHGGVCGCSSGSALCCDGNLSPSCGCD